MSGFNQIAKNCPERNLKIPSTEVLPKLLTQRKNYGKTELISDFLQHTANRTAFHINHMFDLNYTHVPGLVCIVIFIKQKRCFCGIMVWSSVIPFKAGFIVFVLQ
jgi:hypothetical protein